MKVQVVRSFTDRLTGKPYNYGSTYESEDMQRVAELQRGGFLADFPQATVPGAEGTATVGEPEGAAPKRKRTKKE